MKAESCAGRIVLLAKRPGGTSFSSLYTVKRAFKTGKVGHTGTLDSFAQGLLVICTGSLTRLAGHITQFSKTYEAVIRFGTETDTLEHTGTAVRTAPLPNLVDFEAAIARFTGPLMQKPPAFSAIHVNGKRSSDLARQGIAAEIPARKITVHRAALLDVATDRENLVCAAHVLFEVSKGTYIRSLARDIAVGCGSAAHLTALSRTKVGAFSVEDAAGFHLLAPLSLRLMQAEEAAPCAENSPPADSEVERALQDEVRAQALQMTPELAASCGFSTLVLRAHHEAAFRNGVKLSSILFTAPLTPLINETIAVFTERGTFAGLIQKNTAGRFSYGFVERNF